MHTLDEVIDKLILIQREKYNGLLRILELTKVQHDVLLEMDIDKFNELIGLRQNEINEIEKLDKEYSSIINDVKLEYKVTSLEEINISDDTKSYEVQEIVESIKKAMKEVSSYEEENYRILEEQKKEFGDKIKQINQGKRAEKMYQTKGYVQPVFYDKKTHY